MEKVEAFQIEPVKYKLYFHSCRIHGCEIQLFLKYALYLMNILLQFITL